ncbi:FAD-binding oxidoreductase [Halalkalicoccus jeotgali]|uniref:FAD linked oxidase domain protein n=1 Tax=Halalkalicoccus jeotgali (strain DSM 18796 / CECT 7217 / JCM 14584 / KCTC 4019 / B3) TaxID=795797 RepID=D8J3E1_HALJB|nr:FAD-binding oxidoreductase [Halalkalicoccus jeotgali]ADJ15248.1 FAD linked oxidase domain protein [Halalkalicoccus jeotgali B3]ELY35331.1 FAD linked oxidase domain-containing protein [Halalkalicoccus jeotgali B3]
MGTTTPPGEGSERVPEKRLRALAERFDGALIGPEDGKYDEARSVWNGMIDRFPAVIAGCAGVEDVLVAIEFARESELPVAVRGGGHNVSGTAVCDDGIVIDLSGMTAVRVDPDRRVVRAEGGATWADVDRATQRFGLATPGGVVSETGIAGLTLGGGLGHLRRKHGLSSDALVSVEVVTAEGTVLTADEETNPDLFWAVRGGGGNFGVVTAFEYRLYPVGPTVTTCFVWHPGDRVGDALRLFREYAASAPDEASVLAFHAVVPETAEFPEEAWGEAALVFLGCYAGDRVDGEHVFRPLREVADPIVDFSGETEYADFQALLDEDYPDGLNYYWKSLYLTDLSDECIERLLAAGERAPSALSTVDVWQLGGAIARVDPDHTAFAHRSEPFLLGIEANWEDPDDAEENVAWAREVWVEMRPFSSDAIYVNFPGFLDEREDVPRAAYGENYDRLVEVKNRYDPSNLFQANQNVTPTV